MRRLVTFILRLWVNTETVPPGCEGQVECVATGEQMHIRTQEEAVRFIETQIGQPTSVEAQTGKQSDQ